MISYKQFTESSQDKIINVYHGSKNHIKGFDASYLSGGHDQKGPGLYTTENEEEAHGYGHLHHIRLDTSKFIQPKDKPKKAVIKDMIENSPHLDDVVSNYDESSHIGKKKLIDSCMNTHSMHEAMERVWYDGYRADNEAFINQAGLHYHGTTVHPDKFSPDKRHHIIWNAKAIKSIHRHEE